MYLSQSQYVFTKTTKGKVMSLNNSQLAHLWAQQTKSRGKTSNGNFSFEGPSLFSYTTEIARFVDRIGLDGSIEKVVIHTTRSYSVTTTGKHKFWQAIRQYRSFGIDDHLRNVSNDWNEIKVLILQSMNSALEAKINRLKREKTYIQSSLESIGDNVSAIINFIDFNFEDKDTKVEGVLDYATLINLHAERDKTLFESFGVDTTKAFERERKHNESAHSRAGNRAYNRIHRSACSLEDWIIGKESLTSGFYHLPVKLRIRENNIETSHGANVPLDQAIMFYEKIRNIVKLPYDSIDLSKTPIGDFTADKIENNIAFIGCHQIPLDEMERVYLLHKGIIQTKPVMIDQASA